jgi:hypothetical protein
VALVLLAGPLLSACGGDSDEGPSRPATAADRDEVLTTGTPAPVSTTSSTPRSSSPTPSPTPVTSTPDGVLYALITAASDASLTYDKLDYRKTACDALTPQQPVPVPTAFAACFSNVNPLTRTVALSPSATVLVLREGDPPVEVDADALMAFLASPQNTFPPAYSSFRITVAGGKATKVEQFGVSFA